MTKNELAREVSVSEKLHLSTTVKAIDGTLRVIKETLAKGDVVVIRGFGTFTPVEVAERTARNFKTGKPLVNPGPHVCQAPCKQGTGKGYQRRKGGHTMMLYNTTSSNG